ncbi:lipopolysaccharide biosynthesis protein [Ruegeria arenilitoris]|uniref:lipopolysaccharide biosynthesis protein n=1 Tax=Ruegeria arenilitoris TaxID=1173585 RepID=UPI00147D2A3F|nr:hypothetical protein [Ruegeria arenilitoris]
MKNILVFALRMITLRLAVILLSLAQTTLWAAELGVAGFGLVSAFISAQVLLGLGARFGADNVLVRHFRTDPNFPKRFHTFVRAAILASVVVALIGFTILAKPVFGKLTSYGAVAFVMLLLSFNIMQILIQVVVAQKRQVLVTLVGGVLPLLVSLGFFSLPLDNYLSVPRHIQAVAFLALGYFLAAAVLAVLLRDFWAECRAQHRAAPGRMRLLLGSEQWHFLAYQSIGLARVHGTTLAVMALFGPETAGFFALALRFGNLLSYLNEPARMYVLPRVAGSSRGNIWRLYRSMLGLNAGLFVIGVLSLAGLYFFVQLPFSTDPPFLLYTVIIMAGAAVNLCVGPVGAILAQSGNEKRNLTANILGFGIASFCLLLAWALNEPVAAVLGVSLSTATINLSNTLSLMQVMRDPIAGPGPWQLGRRRG